MSDHPTECVYGPVWSRRTGFSLGIDIVPFKTCSYDCVYCQLGSGFSPTTTRKQYVGVEKVEKEVDRKLQCVSAPDYMTLGGSGEPVLNSSFGLIASKLSSQHDIPLCLLTNGSLLWRKDVREECKPFSLIIPSLDACDEKTFRLINRPHPSLRFEDVLEGLEKLSDEFSGDIWLEIFLVSGLNDSLAQGHAFKRLIERINPDKVQLNTAVRPAAESFVQQVSKKRIRELKELFGSVAESVTDQPARKGPPSGLEENDVLGILRRRPCTVTDIAFACKTSEETAAKKLNELHLKGRISPERRGDRIYYRHSSNTSSIE